MEQKLTGVRVLLVLTVVVCCSQAVLMTMFFFFQAEDGIRDRDVTGVQTCALPISEVEMQLS